MSKKLIITEKINCILDEKNITAYKLSQLMQVTDSALYQMIGGETPFSEKFIDKILPHIKVSKEEFVSWIIADKYSKEVLEHAVKVKRESMNSDKPILTVKIDEILQNKSMSRTQLSKLVKYDQSAVNKMITRKISFSKVVLSRLLSVLEVPEDEIKSWIVADKYTLQVLELALGTV